MPAAGRRWWLLALLSLRARCVPQAEANEPLGRAIAATYDCEAGRSGWRAWSAAKRAHCCRSGLADCSGAPAAADPPPTEEAASAEARGRRLLGPCDTVCGYKGKSFSCAARVRYTAAHDFQGKAGSCGAAFGSVLAQCGMCSSCPLSQTGCSEPKAPPLAPPAPAPHSAMSSAAACSQTCSYKGKSASCAFRITWGAHHKYKFQSQACKKAWIMVATQCSECTPCTAEQAGCVELPPPPSTTTRPPVPFDCMPDHTNRVAGWSHEKRKWCCANRGHGCEMGGHGGESWVPFDCLSGFKDWRTVWSEDKRRWCCRHRRRGCLEPPSDERSSSSTSAAPPPRYECHKGDPPDWSDAQRDWCCENADRGCKKTADRPGRTEDPRDGGGEPRSYDCSRAEDRGSTWSRRKKAWCCERKSVGCASTPAPFDCLAGYAKWEENWPREKVQWCCEHHSHGPTPPGCPSTKTSAQPYDCTAGASKWQTGWSDGKKDWCCKHKEVHCPDRSYDCHEDLSEWQRRWSLAKKDWCCKHEEVHCGREPFDCKDDSYAWPSEQQDWCCKHKKTGCERPGAAAAKFESRAGRPIRQQWRILPLGLPAALAASALAAALLRPLRRRLAARESSVRRGYKAKPLTADTADGLEPAEVVYEW